MKTNGIHTTPTANMSGFQCARCGQYHDHLPMCLGAPVPEPYAHIPQAARKTRVVLSPDQCVIDGRFFFVLGRIQISVKTQNDPFTWLCWTSVSATDFQLFYPATNKKHPTKLSCTAGLATVLPYGLTTLGLKCRLTRSRHQERPLIQLLECEHPLYFEQQNGISPKRLQEIMEAAFHGQSFLTQAPALP